MRFIYGLIPGEWMGDMKKLSYSAITLLTVTVLISIPYPNAEAATYTVTTTNDTGPGSLRTAIDDANSNPGFDTINFSIAGTGPHRIAPTSSLPTISDAVLIDGYSQTNASANTQLIGNDAVMMIELHGSSITNDVSSGLLITASGVTVQGLVINGFNGGGIKNQDASFNHFIGNFIGTTATGDAALPNLTGIILRGISSGVEIGGATPSKRNIISGNKQHGIVALEGSCEFTVKGNYVGTDATGSISVMNEFNGIYLIQATNAIIGGTTDAERNLISGNRVCGFFSSQSPGTQVLGNYVGLGGDGTTPISNGTSGILILDSNDNRVGDGTAAGENRIAHNGNEGIGIKSITEHPTTGNRISRNRIFRNARGLGINLDADDVTSNDVIYDPDDGPNRLQNFPELTLAEKVAGPGTRVEGVLSSTVNTTFSIEFFGNTLRDSSGYGEGEFYLGTTNVTTDGTGLAYFDVTVGSSAGPWISSTATDLGTMDTSEFSPCIAVTGTSLVVTNEAASGPGTLDDAVSLVNSISDSGVVHEISFNIPGSGPKVVNITAPITVTVPVSIRGDTQPGTPPGSRGIEMTSTSGVAGPLLNVDSDNVTVEGIAFLNNSGPMGVGASNSDGFFILNCNIGVGADGVTSGSLADIMVISGSDDFNVSGNIMGSSFFDGVSVSACDNGLFSNNRLGVNAVDGYLGTGGSGLRIWNSQNIRVEDNIIGNNTYEAVLLETGSKGVSINRNRFFNNGTQHIDILPFGPNPNDAMDTDTGINCLQNTPTLAGAATSAGGIQVVGSLNSAPEEDFIIDFFSGSDGSFITSGTNTTDINGDGTFHFSSSSGSSAPSVFATVTDQFGNTSESIPPLATVAGPEMTGIEMTGPGVDVSFTSVSGQTYDLRARTDLITDPGIFVHSDVPGTGGVITLPVPHEEESTLFIDASINFP